MRIKIKKETLEHKIANQTLAYDGQDFYNEDYVYFSDLGDSKYMDLYRKRLRERKNQLKLGSI